MRKWKKYVRVALVGCCMTLTSLIATASAVNVTTEDSFEVQAAMTTASTVVEDNVSGGQLQKGEKILSNEDQIELIQNDESLSLERKMEMVEKLKKKGQSRASYRACDLGVGQIRQDTGYYCGPASAMQVLKYYYDLYKNNSMFNVSMPASQNILANVIGTTTDGSTGSGVAKGMNHYQDYCSYVTKQINSKSDFMDDIDSALNVGLAPLILRSRLSANSDFGYASSGHFMTVSGQTSGLSKVLIVDPYYGYSSSKGPSAARYYVSIDDAYESITSHPASQYIY